MVSRSRRPRTPGTPAIPRRWCWRTPRTPSGITGTSSSRTTRRKRSRARLAGDPLCAGSPSRMLHARNAAQSRGTSGAARVLQARCSGTATPYGRTFGTESVRPPGCRMPRSPHHVGAGHPTRLVAPIELPGELWCQSSTNRPSRVYTSPFSAISNTGSRPLTGGSRCSVRRDAGCERADSPARDLSASSYHPDHGDLTRAGLSCPSSTSFKRRSYSNNRI